MNHWEYINGGSVTVSNTAEELWQNAAKYFKWCDDNPVTNQKLILSGKLAGELRNETIAQPYTIKGLCLHCGIMEEYLNDMLTRKDKTSMYYIVVKKIIYIIWEQNASRAITGSYNPIFTAKMLNIDKEDTTPQPVQVNIVSGLPTLSTSENQIIEKLEIEKGKIIKRD